MSIKLLQIEINSFQKLFKMIGDSSKKHPKDKFKQEDDEKLIDIVKKVGILDWCKIAKMMGNKNPRQCKDRWTNYLAPNINKTPFSLNEDLMLIELHKILGCKWTMIASYFHNRSDVSIKSRFKILQRRNQLQYLKDAKLYLNSNQFNPNKIEIPESPPSEQYLSDNSCLSEIDLEFSSMIEWDNIDDLPFN